MKSARLIMVHKQATSARTRFLMLSYGGFCGFEPLPEDAVSGGNSSPAHGSVAVHPGGIVKDAETRLGLATGSLKIEAGCRQVVNCQGGPIFIFLATFTTIDPPWEAATTIGARFVGLPEVRGVRDVELELVRSSYEEVMG